MNIPKDANQSGVLYWVVKFGIGAIVVLWLAIGMYVGTHPNMSKKEETQTYLVGLIATAIAFYGMRTRVRISRAWTGTAHLRIPDNIFEPDGAVRRVYCIRGQPEVLLSLDEARQRYKAGDQMFSVDIMRIM